MEKAKGFVVVHVGAGYHSPQNSELYKAICKQACAENSQYTNAGTGSNLTVRGTVECDASLMEGSSLHYGAVGAVPEVKNPILLAKHLLQTQKQGTLSLGRIPPSTLVGAGALDWAQRNRIETIKPVQLITTASHKAYVKNKRKLDILEDELNKRRHREKSNGITRSHASALDSLNGVVASIGRPNHVTAASSLVANKLGNGSRKRTHVTDRVGHMASMAGHVTDTSGYLSDTSSHVTDTSENTADTSGYITDASVQVVDAYSHRKETAGHVTNSANHRTDKPGHTTDVVGHVKDAATHVPGSHVKDTSGHVTDDSSLMVTRSAGKRTLDQTCPVVNGELDIGRARNLLMESQVPVHLSPQRKKRKNGKPDDLQDTVGAVCVDHLGHVASAVSSGGIVLKQPGRLGQAAIYGCGCWAENVRGSSTAIGVTTSGCGEHLTKTVLAKECADSVRRTGDPTTGISEVFNDFLDSPFLDDVKMKLGGALVVRSDTEDDGALDVEVLWVHTTDSMCLAYVSTSDVEPTALVSRLPSGKKCGMSYVIQSKHCHVTDQPARDVTRHDDTPADTVQHRVTLCE